MELVNTDMIDVTSNIYQLESASDDDRHKMFASHTWKKALVHTNICQLPDACYKEESACIWVIHMLFLIPIIVSHGFINCQLLNNSHFSVHRSAYLCSDPDEGIRASKVGSNVHSSTSQPLSSP